MDPDTALRKALEHLLHAWGPEDGKPITYVDYALPYEDLDESVGKVIEERLSAAELLRGLAEWLEKGGFPPTVVKKDIRGVDYYCVIDRCFKV